MATTEQAPVSTDIVEFDSSASSNVRSVIAAFEEGDTGIMTTFRGDDFFQVAKAQLAATTGSEPISDHLGETIMLDNFVIQPVEMPAVDAKGQPTGELLQSARVTLVDSTNKKSYHGTSMALVNGLQQIVAALGKRLPAEWAEPLPVKVVEEKSRQGYKFFNIVVVL